MRENWIKLLAADAGLREKRERMQEWEWKWVWVPGCGFDGRDPDQTVKAEKSIESSTTKDTQTAATAQLCYSDTEDRHGPVGSAV